MNAYMNIYKIFSLIFLKLFFINFCLTQPQWNNTNFDFDTIEHQLKTEEIIDSKPIYNVLKENGQLNFNSVAEKYKVSLVTLSDNTKAIFKPIQDKKILHAEIAAYKVSKMLKFNLVPPTVYRKFNNLHGIIQLYIPFTYKNTKEQTKILKNLSQKIKNMDLIFKFILGQSDSNKSNYIITINNNSPQLALIDNEAIHRIQDAEYGQSNFILVSPLKYFNNIKELKNKKKPIL